MSDWQYKEGGARWNYLKQHLLDLFAEPVYKIGVDAGFDCPNRDGSKAFGGCAYCSQEGSLASQQDPKLGLIEQIKKGQDFNKHRYGAKKYIAYFQAFTNTYAPVSVLRERFEAAFIDDSIVGLSVASRPDCINEDNIGYLAELAERLPFFTVELGLQSVYQNRLKWVNRQETVEDYEKAMELLNKHKVKVVTHVILGFPGESIQEMEDTVFLADRLGSAGIKLQMLHVIKATKLAHRFLKEPFKLMDEKEYLKLIVHLVERLSPGIVIHRITGETERSKLIEPKWVHFKTRFFNAFHQELRDRNSFQGKFYSDQGHKKQSPVSAGQLQ